MGQRGGAVFSIVFGSVFLAVGVGVGYFSLRPLAEVRAMKTWRETPAKVVSCELSVSHGSKGGTSYQAKATYRYRVDGTDYTGTRVSLHGGHDNVGGFQRRTYEMLNRCRAAGRPTTCWVDPLAPSKSILIRRPRFELLLFMQAFVLLFGGAGVWIVSAGAAALFRPGVSAGSEAVGQGQIRMRGAASHRIAGAVALAVNGYAGWFLWIAYGVSLPEPLPPWLWLLALAGVVPAIVAGYLIGRYRKYGISVFEMSPMPGTVGGTVGGTIRIPAKVDAPDGFEVTLQCVHQYTTRSGKNSSTHRDVLWEDAQHVAEAYAFGEESMMPVRFTVPDGQPATTAAVGSNGYYWQLKASAVTPGIDYKAVFEVPMRRSPLGATASPLSMPVHAAAPVGGVEPVGPVAARAGLKLEGRPDGGFSLTFPAGLAKASIVFLAVFVTAWSAVCAVLWTVAKAPFAFALIFSVFDAVFTLILLNTVFVSRGIVVDRAVRECVVWWRAPVFGRRESRVAFENVADIRSERAGQSGNTLYYRIVLDKGVGVPLTVGSGLTMWTAAEDLAKLLRASLKAEFALDAFRL